MDLRLDARFDIAETCGSSRVSGISKSCPNPGEYSGHRFRNLRWISLAVWAGSLVFLWRRYNVRANENKELGKEDKFHGFFNFRGSLGFYLYAALSVLLYLPLQIYLNKVAWETIVGSAAMPPLASGFVVLPLIAMLVLSRRPRADSIPYDRHLAVPSLSHDTHGARTS